MIFSDTIFITEDNPRFEDSKQIFNQMTNGLGSKELKKIKIIRAREEAICQAINTIKKNDILLIAGKGHETSQTIGIETLPFDDYTVAKETIKNIEKVREPF